MQFPLLTNSKCTASGMKYIHVAQLSPPSVSRTLSSSHTATLSLDTKSLSPLPRTLAVTVPLPVCMHLPTVNTAQRCDQIRHKDLGMCPFVPSLTH